MSFHSMDGGTAAGVQNVASVTQKDGQLVFTDIMGIPTVVNGQIEKIDLMENEIIIRKATA